MGRGQNSADHQPERQPPQGTLLPPAGVEAAVTLFTVSPGRGGGAHHTSVAKRLFLWCFTHQSDDSGRLLSPDRMVSFHLRGRRRRAVRDELPPSGSGTLFDLLFSQDLEISWKITTTQKEKQHFLLRIHIFQQLFLLFLWFYFFFS